MTLPELLHRANQGFPDGYLIYYYNADTGEVIDGKHGDTLAEFVAEFVVRELVDTYEPDQPAEEQIRMAGHVIKRAADDLLATVAAIRRLAKEPPPTEAQLRSIRSQPVRERTRVINLD